MADTLNDKIIDNLKQCHISAVPVNPACQTYAGAVVSVNFIADFLIDDTKLVMQLFQSLHIVFSVSAELGFAVCQSFQDIAAYRIVSSFFTKEHNHKCKDDSEGCAQSQQTDTKSLQRMCRSDLEKNERHTGRKIVGRIVFVDQCVCEPEQGDSIDDDAKGQVDDSHKCKQSHDYIDQPCFAHAFIMIADISETEKRKRDKWCNHRIVHSETKIIQKKYKCNYDCWKDRRSKVWF